MIFPSLGNRLISKAFENSIFFSLKSLTKKKAILISVDSSDSGESYSPGNKDPLVYLNYFHSRNHQKPFLASFSLGIHENFESTDRNPRWRNSEFDILDFVLELEMQNFLI